jgi:6-phosphogluconolactonase (cycloisomerase 2 family)
MRQINLKFKRAIFLFMVAFASICNYAHAQVATITSFNPLAARPGDGLTIIGTNFNTTAANNIVYFGTVRASVAAATATSLVVSVPDGAIYGPITIQNSSTGLSSRSRASFIPIYSPAKNEITNNDFSSNLDITTGSGPNAVAIGDLDGDGKLDVVVANQGSNTISVYRNTSTSGTLNSTSFSSKVDFTTATNPLSVAIGDLDQDGKQDIVVANVSSNSISVFRNTSTSGSITSGSFAAKVDFTTGLNPFSVAIGDLDGDGKFDIAVTNSNAGNVSVFRNTSTNGSISTSSFAAKIDYLTGSNPYSVAIGDIDGDGNQDLVIANNGSDNVSVLRNYITGGTLTVHSFATLINVAAGSSPRSVAIGDLNEDGKPDIVVANQSSNTVSVLRNNSSSGSIFLGSVSPKVDFTTGSSPRSVAISDLDGDGKADLIVANNGSNTISVLRNTGSLGAFGAFSSSSFSTKVDFSVGSFPLSAIVADLDGDRKSDIVAVNTGSNSLALLRSTNNISFLNSLALSSGTLSPDFASAISTYTTNVSNATSTISVTPTRTDATSNIQVRVNNGSYTTTTSGSPSGALALNVGTNTIDVLVTAQNLSTRTYSVTITRLSNNADLSALSLSSGVLSPAFAANTTVYTSNVLNAITSITVTPTVSNTNASVQVNGISVSSGNVSGSIPLNIGNNTINVIVTAQDGTTKTYTVTITRAEGTPVISTINPAFAKSGDVVTLSGSGFSNISANNIVYFGATKATVNTATSTSLNVTVPVGATYGPVTLLNTVTGLATLSLPNFTPTHSPTKVTLTTNDFLSKVDLAVGSLPFSSAIGDLDGDGKTDLVVANANANTISIFRNISSSGSLSSGSFASKIDFTTGSVPVAIVIADFDGDGKPDLAVANRNSSNISIFRNTAMLGSITSSSFATKVDFSIGANITSLAAGDFDDDGKIDLVTVGGYNNVFVIRNTATSGTITSSSFETRVSFTTDLYPASVAVGDLDGDGKPDIAIANENPASGTGSVSILRNVSTRGSITTSSFSAKVDFEVGSKPLSLSIGDLDGDGKPELAVANSQSSNVSVFYNTSTSGNISTSSFAAKVDFATGSFPYAVAIADFNGDGKPDLAFANYNSGNVSILSNTGTAGSISSSSFATKVDFPTNSGARSISVGDLDGDNKPDIVTANQSTDNISIIRNRTVADLSNLTLSSGILNPTFAANTINYTATVSNATSSITVTPTIADVNVTIAVNGTNVNSGTASGSIALSVGTNTITVVLTAQDATTNTYTINITRATPPPPTISSLSSLTAEAGSTLTITGTNFNTTASNNIVFFGSTMAIVSSSTSTVVNVTVPVGATYAPITLLNTSTGLTASSKVSFTPTYNPTKSSITASDFLAKQDFATGSTPFSVAMGDLDGDGKSDLVVANYLSSSVSLYRNTSTNGNLGSSSFANRVDFTTGLRPIYVSLSDLDGDGKLDIVVANYSANTISLLRNTATNGSIDASSFAAKVDFATGNSPISIAISDLDGDGKQDIAVANYYSNTVSLFRNIAITGSLTTASLIAKEDFVTGSNPNSVAVSDLDGDGKTDLAVANKNSNSVSVFRNTTIAGTINSSSFEVKQDFTTDLAPVSVSVGDLDGDGKPDLATANGNNNTFSVLRNTSSTGAINTNSFATKVDFATGVSPFAIPSSLFMSDLNGDGKLDVAATITNFNVVALFVNTATSGTIASGSFATNQDFATGQLPSSIAIGDLDGDNRPDLAIVNRTSTSLSIFRGLNNNSNLSGLVLSSGSLSPTFATNTTTYTADVANSISTITVTPTRTHANGIITVNGTTVVSGSASGTIALTEGTNTITIEVTAENATTKTYTITVTRAPLVFNALHFDGSNDYVRVANNTALETSVGTVELWARPTWTPGSRGANPGMIGMRSSSGTRFSWHIRSGYGALDLFNGSGVGSISYAFTQNTWYHFAFVYSQTNCTVYINGVNAGTTGRGISAATGQPLCIGISGDGLTSEAWGGNIDEVRIWNTQRTASEISANMNKEVFPSTTGLVSYYNFNQGVAGGTNTGINTLTNSTSSSLNGSLLNFALTGSTSNWVAGNVINGASNSSNANLSVLTTTAGSLTPIFASGTTSYAATVGILTTSVTVTLTVADATATIQVRINSGSYTTVASSTASSALNLNVGSNTIDVQVTAEDGTTIKTYTITVLRTPLVTWTGTTSTDWNTASNWNPAFVPSSIDSVSIPSGTPNAPNNVGTVTVASLTVLSGVTVTNSGTINVTEALTNGGTITGNVVLNGAAEQNIEGVGIINNLTLNNSAGATINSGNVSITGTLTISSGTFNTRGLLTLKSTASGTARIASGTGSYISGNITVERYIPGGRRTSRFLGHPFSNALNMSSLIDDIYVTGNGGSSNGFDVTSTNNPSTYWFNNGTQNWTAFTSATDASWAQYRGIRVLIRGDRNQPTALTSSTIIPNEVTLDMTGTVNIGNQNVPVPTGYSVISNPYPSTVNIGQRLFNTANIGTQYWVWDANAGPIAGAYVTKIITNSSYNLAMNGAFVVEPISATTINFVEADKTTTVSDNLFRTSNLSGLLQLQVLYNNYPADNVYVRFNNSASDNKESLDGGKLTNPEVNLYALSADNFKLSLDTRVYSNNKVIPLGFTATAANTFTIKVADLGIAEEVYLKDKLLNIETKLDATTAYTFSADPASATTVGDNRFELVFRTSGALPTSFVNIVAQQKGAAIEVSFNTANETNMQSYEIEESNDGSTFTKGTSIKANNTATANYSWLDVSVNNGNNYYRVKAIEKNGTIKYSQVVRVNIGKQGAEFTVYPNPVKGRTINLQLTDIEKGIYTVKVVNNLGQEIAAKVVNHNGGSSTQTIGIGIAPSGTYSLVITKGTTTIVTKTVIVE